jgi:DedD protein
MERKSTQRIIGILVVAALIVILLPLLFEGDNTTAQTTTIKEPPFPSQHTEAIPNQPPVASQASTQGMDNSITISQELATQLNPQTIVIAPTQNPQPTPPHPTVVKTQPPHPPVVKTQTVAQSSPPKLADHPVISTTANIIKPKKMAEIKIKPVKKAVTHHSSHHDLTQLKSAAWVVQMGNFKVKSNAIRLADKLRAQGFKAFTREIKSNHGDSVRVYVGPEFKQASAASLNDKIEQEMKMRGVIVSYHPLEL